MREQDSSLGVLLRSADDRSGWDQETTLGICRELVNVGKVIRKQIHGQLFDLQLSVMVSLV